MMSCYASFKQTMTENILVVDDNPNNLRLLINMLTQQGYKVRPASSGSHALVTIKKDAPDLILLDIQMPEINGYEVCRRLKANEQTQHIPVIFLSALNELFDKMTAFDVGGVDYITKPFQVEEVLARIQTHLALQKARQELEQKNQQLMEQNRELDAFAQTVAHDLRSPLTSVFNAMALLQEFAVPSLTTDMQRVFEISINASKKMNRIIDELLLLASVRKGEIQPYAIDMRYIIKQVQQRLAHQIDDSQAEITLPNQWPRTFGHGPWVEEVWSNYISNGIKYGGKPPKLELGYDEQPDGFIRFWVKDNGAGIPLEAQAHLFTEFTRLNQNQAKGHGLGLSIVRRIMDKLDGQAGIESDGNSGCLFYFTLKGSTAFSETTS